MEETVGISDTGLARESFGGWREPLFGSQTGVMLAWAAYVGSLHLQW